MRLPTLPSGLTATPFGDAFRTLSAVFPELGIEEVPAGGHPREGGGWVTTEALASGGEALDTFLAWDDEQVLRDYGQAGRPDVVAGFGLHRYAWPVCLVFTVPWFLRRRVPRVAPSALSLHRELGSVSVRIDTFACLPDDPAATLPGAHVVPDEEALRAELRGAVADHLTPLLAGFGPRMRRGAQALWGMATDEIVEGLWYIGELLGQEDRAVAELGLLLPGSAAPYKGSAAFRDLTDDRGRILPTRDRVACCLFYTLRPDDTCGTCPRTCDTERVRKLSTRS